MTKLYDTIVFLLRGQPVHNAHAAILGRAASLAEQVVVIIGSCGQPRTYKNPFTADERKHMIRGSTGAFNTNIVIEENTDTIYNDQAWAARIQALVAKHTNPQSKIAIIGHKKDSSTQYLDMFPQWKFVEQELIEPLNATNIRDLYFRKDCNLKYIEGVVPKSTLLFLESFMKTEEYEQVIREREFIDNYKKQFAGLAYPPIFVTTDAVVICSGHVAMIKRRAEPGKGLWAMPGGFVNAATDRSIQDAMIRELREETGIKVPKPVLIGSIIKTQVFDAIDRSTRGRTITHCFRIDLPNGELPKIKGMDDAIKAEWVPIGGLDSSLCFEDHYEIIQNMLGA
jgi:bifunctional NMN adenylyltransferase/nudix hydrolase